MWCFARVNGKLAEIYFEEKRGKNEKYTDLQEFRGN